MPNTFAKRATHALRTGDESFAPRTAKNRTLLEEMKKKLKNELAGDVAEGKACIHNAGDKAVRRVNDAADVAEEKITAAAADAIAKALTKRGFTPEAQAAKHACSTASSAACSKTSTATSIPDSGTTRPSSSTQLGSPSQQPPSNAAERAATTSASPGGRAGEERRCGADIEEGEEEPHPPWVASAVLT